MSKHYVIPFFLLPCPSTEWFDSSPETFFLKRAIKNERRFIPFLFRHTSSLFLPSFLLLAPIRLFKDEDTHHDYKNTNSSSNESNKKTTTAVANNNNLNIKLEGNNGVL